MEVPAQLVIQLVLNAHLQLYAKPALMDIGWREVLAANAIQVVLYVAILQQNVLHVLLDIGYREVLVALVIKVAHNATLLLLIVKVAK